jgi:hypothetical protein
MPRERAFWLVLASLVVAGALYGWWGRRERIRPLALVPGSPQPVAQETEKRSFRPARYRRVYELPAGERGAPAQPTLLRTGSRGELFVLDSGRRRVVQVSSNGAVISAYSHPSLGEPTDFAVGPAGEVWICDPDRGGVAMFSPSGELVRQIALEPAVGRLALDPGGGLVATSLAGGQGLFRRYSHQDLWTGSFGSLFQPELQNAYAVDGWFVPAGRSLIYLFRQAGLMICYTMDGRLRFFRRTIDPVPLPKVHIDGSGIQSVSRDAPLASISGSVVGGELWVLSAEPGTHGRVIDVYDAATGAYRHSLRPPEQDLRYVVATPDRIFGASPKGIAAWRLAP